MKKRLFALTALLSNLFGPSGCEDAVRAVIRDELGDLCDSIRVDAVGNLIACIKGHGKGYDPENPIKIMISAHMDEVGFMITDADERGCLHFTTVGGIDPRVLCGRPIRILAGGERLISGVIASLPIHMRSSGERGKYTPTDKLYIDIGASSKDEALALVSIGDYATFDTEFSTMGTDGVKLVGKALDDRLGCAIMICLAEQIAKSQSDRPYDLYLSFGTREEIGRSGTVVATASIRPDLAIVLESTAAADIASVSEESRVATQGEGGALSLADRSTIYDRDLALRLLNLGKSAGIPIQLKRFVSGGNDSSHIQRSGGGVRVAALSAPSRYIHSPTSVVDRRDVESMAELVLAFLSDRDGALTQMIERSF